MGREPRVVNTGRGSSHGRGLRRRARVLRRLVAAACLVAMPAVGLVGCSSQGTGELGGSASASATSVAATPSPAPGPTASPSHFPAWSGAPGYIQGTGRLNAEFGWAMAARDPYDLRGSNGRSTVPTKLYLTYDGGASWVDRTPANDGPYSFLYIDLHFADPANAWFVENVFSSGDGMAGTELDEHWVYRTGDGGLTWAKYHVPLPSIYIASEFDMADGVHGLITTMGNDQRQQLWGTSDGGATWTKLIDVLWDPNFNFPQSPTMVSADEGWALRLTDNGKSRAVLHSTDGGRSWKSAAALPLPTGVDALWSVQPASRWAHQAPAGSTAVLSIGGMAVMGGGWEYVTWISHDTGDTWAIGSATPVGKGNQVYLSAQYIGLQSGASLISIRYFDISSPGSVAVFDASDPCSGTEMHFGLGYMVSPDDVWGGCGHATPEGVTDHLYLYGTKDGGLTWTPLMGAP